MTEEDNLRQTLLDLVEAARALLNTEERSRVGTKPWDDQFYHFEKWAIRDLELAVDQAAATLGEAPRE